MINHFPFFYSLNISFSTVIGEGGFGRVYHGKYMGVEIAVKLLTGDEFSNLKGFESEINVHSSQFFEL